jgi:hypothetical protein
MTVVERVGEAVARATTRRRFLERSAVAMFGMAATASVAGLRPAGASANACEENWSGCSCSPYGTCPQSRDCSAGNCNTTYCTYYTSPHSSTGCWCQMECCYRCGTCQSYCGYYKCCDCVCEASHTLCTCQGFIYTCTSAARSADSAQAAGPAGPKCPVVCC